MSVYSLNEALLIQGVTPEEKLLLIIMTARGLDTDGCYPKRGFPLLCNIACLSTEAFDKAIRRLYKRGIFTDCISDGEASVKVLDWSEVELEAKR